MPVPRNKKVSQFVLKKPASFSTDKKITQEVQRLLDALAILPPKAAKIPYPVDKIPTPPNYTVCHYCSSHVMLGKNHFGEIYICCGCRAYVGCHKGTTIPLGIVARKELRDLRRKGHDLLAALQKINEDMGVPKARQVVYQTLAVYMVTKPRETHMGWMNEEQAKKAIKFLEDTLT